MPIPSYEEVMRPLLEHLADGTQRTTRETIDALAPVFGLSQSELDQRIPSGTQPLFNNRVAWAKTYLKKAGLIESPARGEYRITSRGQSFLTTGPRAISSATLLQFDDFRDFLSNRGQAESESEGLVSGASAQAPALRQGGSEILEGALTPEEHLALGYSRINSELAIDLLDRVKGAPPEFFEQLVVDLLLALGYGGSRREAGETVGRSGDGGIDGVINEDRLGLDTVYIQAKRWEGTVGRPEVQKFAGALQATRSTKGVFLTTSSFSSDAKAFVTNIGSKIVLIDGTHLTRLMIEHNIGVTPVRAYELKRIDSDYFSEE